MNIGAKIQTLRKQKGLSQEQLAAELGVSRQAVSKWEAEQSIPDLDKVVSLCDYFDISSDYLLRDICESSAELPLPSPAEEKEHERDVNTYYNEKTASDYSQADSGGADKKHRLSAILLAISIMLYIMCVIPPIAIQDNVIGPIVMFVMIAAATGLIIYRSIAFSKPEQRQSTAVYEKNNDPVRKAIAGCVWAADIAAYFIVSFATGAWYITWLIFPIGGAVGTIALSVYDLVRSDGK